MTEQNECRQAREKLGMTQAQFAEIFDVNQSTIHKLEQGKITMTQKWRLALKAVEGPGDGE